MREKILKCADAQAFFIYVKDKKLRVIPDNNKRIHRLLGLKNYRPTS